MDRSDPRLRPVANVNHARIFFALITLALFALPLVPTVTAQEENVEEVTSEVTFYGHVFGTGRGRPMPMNTQFPKGEADLSQGLSAHHCGTPDITCEDDTGNEVWLYTTAGFVQIKEFTEFDYGKLHNERGLTKDTYLDRSRDITAEFYMSGDLHGWLLAFCTPGVPRDVPWPVPCWNWDPGYLSQWQIEATVYTGVLGEYGGAADEQPDIGAALEANKLVPLATGVSEPTDVQSLEATGNPTVWKFDINLGKPLRDVIKKEESYVVRFQWWSLKPNGEKMIIPEMDVWNVNSGEFFPPLVKLPVKGAFNVEMVLPQFVYGKLVVLGIMNTPWGSYDVDHDSIQLEIKNTRTGAIFEPRSIQRLADFSVAHGGHYKPVNVTYVWDHMADKLPAGDYDVTISAANYQNSASASCVGGFIVGENGNAGEIRVGQCGVRTITDDQLNTVREGSQNDASQGTGALPVPEISLFAAPLLFIAFRRWKP